MELWIVIRVNKGDDPKTLVEDLIIHCLKHTFSNISIERIGDTVLVYKRT